MENNLALRRTLTDLDHVRLTNLIRREGADGAAASRALELDDLLDNADVVPAREVGPDVVTMYSQVQVRDTQWRAQRVTVCYPTDAEPTAVSRGLLTHRPELLGCKGGVPLAFAAAVNVGECTILFSPKRPTTRLGKGGQPAGA